MTFALISDLHIKNDNDNATNLFIQFINHPKVIESQKIILLGDMFDLLVGNHEEYYSQYKTFFSSLRTIIERGQKIIYFEGNHDLHLKKLLKKWLEKNNLPHSSLILHRKPEIIKWNEKKLYLTHGDEIDYDNFSYLLYRRSVSSGSLDFIADYLMPYKIFELAGKLAAKQSKKRSSKYFDREKNREKYRLGASLIKDVDIVISGHTHIKDDVVLENGIRYLNNGYMQNSKTFILATENELYFCDLM
jgi:UDP-2,3-diacylglucosamine hydrolase